jgi:hypothetical protein
MEGPDGLLGLIREEAMKGRLFTHAVSIVSLIFSRALVVILLTCNLNAASLQPSETRQDWQDLEVITLDSQSDPAKTVYYTYDQLLTLPAVTVKTDRDPNTNNPVHWYLYQRTFRGIRRGRLL